jgi:AraC-like DNA-binding protein
MKSGHCLMTEKLSKVAGNYRSILFFFSNEDVLKFIRKFELTQSDSSKLLSTYSFSYDAFITRFVDSLLDISKLSNALQKNILDAKFEEIMLYLIEFKGVEFLYSLISNSNNQNQKFIQTIENNQLNKLTIKELSFLLNMSVSTFKREFEKHFHSSPSKWFQEKRLEHAAFLLKSNSKRPSDIYEEVGYENLSNFIQAFKMKFGVTPKQYQSE